MMSLLTQRHSWVYAKHFVQRVQLADPPGAVKHCDWSDATSEFRQKYAFRPVVPLSSAPVQERTTLHYMSGGAVGTYFKGRRLPHPVD